VLPAACDAAVAMCVPGSSQYQVVTASGSYSINGRSAAACIPWGLPKINDGGVCDSGELLGLQTLYSLRVFNSTWLQPPQMKIRGVGYCTAAPDSNASYLDGFIKKTRLTYRNM
jgi:hypothetical protein